MSITTYQGYKGNFVNMVLDSIYPIITDDYLGYFRLISAIIITF